MEVAITIPARFNGPPASGNGGYSCGLLAAHLRVAEMARWDETLKGVKAMLAAQHGLHHVTLQPEAEAPCDQPPCEGARGG